MTHGDESPAPWSSRGMAIAAAFMSLLAPGLGHIVMGRVGRGLVWFIGYMAFAFAVGISRPASLLILSVVIAVDALVIGLTPEEPVDHEQDDEEDAWKPLG